MNTSYSFTKLVVDDLEAMVRFYGEAYGLKRYDRLEGAIGGEPIEEIMLGTTDARTGGVILIKYTERGAPPLGEIILGFMTDDIEAAYARAVAAGARVVAPIKDEPEKPYKVGFVADPEGHLAEIVELRSPAG